MHGEFSRKFVHITVGSFVAFWPFFLNWYQIQLLSVAFLICVAISKYFRIFQAIHSVQRPTWGEVFFAAAVGLITLVTQDKFIYAAALLQMSLADGLAAVIGVHLGRRNRYRLFGRTKSIAGTLTFFIVSLAILLALGHWHVVAHGFGYVLLISLLATALENLAPDGLDNLAVPLLAVFMLVK